MLWFRSTDSQQGVKSRWWPIDLAELVVSNSSATSGVNAEMMAVSSGMLKWATVWSEGVVGFMPKTVLVRTVAAAIPTDRQPDATTTRKLWA